MSNYFRAYAVDQMEVSESRMKTGPPLGTKHHDICVNVPLVALLFGNRQHDGRGQRSRTS